MSYLVKNCILQFSQRFLVQIQKCSCLMCVDGLTSTFDDMVVVKEAQYLHPQKVGAQIFSFLTLYFLQVFYTHHETICAGFILSTYALSLFFLFL